MILTSCRVICLNKKNSAFKAFDLPLSLISNEGFAQPIFGANYLHGTCKPLLNSLPGDINFKIWFMSGGCGTFAPAYLKMVASCRRNKGRGAEQSAYNFYQNQGQRKTAYIDPNDPSVIYLQQPEISQNINYNPFGQYQPIPQGPQMQVGPQQMAPQPYPPQPMPQQAYQQPPYQHPPYQQPPYQQPPYQQPPYQQQPMIEKPMSNHPINSAPAPQAPYNQAPNNNYPNYPQNVNNPPQNQQNNSNMMPPNVGNNINNNYPVFNEQNFNQHTENDLPSLEEVNNNSQPINPNVYPNQGMGGLNGVVNNNQNQEGGKYFGFWGPNLNKNPNN